MSIIQLKSFTFDQNYSKNSYFQQKWTIRSWIFNVYEKRGPLCWFRWVPLAFCALKAAFFFAFFCWFFNFFAFFFAWFLPELAILSFKPPGAFPDSSNWASNSSWYSCATLALWDCSLPDATLPCSWTHSSTLSVSWHTKLLTLAQFSSFQKNPPRDFT